MRYLRYIFCFVFFMSYITNVYAGASDTRIGDTNQYVADRDEDATQLANELFAQQGAQLIVLGEDQLIIIPTDQTFFHRASVLKWSAYPFLDDLVNYLQNSRKVNLRVAVYSSSLSDEDNETGLPEERAREIANFLWNKDVDTRVMSVRGYDDDDNDNFPFIANMSPGQFQNGRIEISFRKIREYA